MSKVRHIGIGDSVKPSNDLTKIIDASSECKAVGYRVVQCSVFAVTVEETVIFVVTGVVLSPRVPIVPSNNLPEVVDARGDSGIRSRERIVQKLISSIAVQKAILSSGAEY
jgi:hypothetical protein